MTSPATSRVSQLLFHPFLRIAGAPSLILGLGLIFAAGWIGAGRGVHFDGVLDTHVGHPVPLWMALSEGFIDWLSLAVILYVAGWVVSRTAFRAIDLFGTQALARWPSVIISIACLAPGFHRFSAQLMKSLQKMASDPTKFALPAGGIDAVVFGLVTLLMLVCAIWMVALMWKSFSHCCNVRGGRAVGAFVVGLLLAEVLSKVLIMQMFKTL